MLASLLVPRWITGRAKWTDDLAMRLQQASHNYHAALHALAHVHPGAESHEAGVDAARREYARCHALLVAAQTRGQRTARLLRWSGLLGCAGGLLLYAVHLLVQPRP